MSVCLFENLLYFYQGLKIWFLFFFPLHNVKRYLLSLNKHMQYSYAYVHTERIYTPNQNINTEVKLHWQVHNITIQGLRSGTCLFPFHNIKRYLLIFNANMQYSYAYIHPHNIHMHTYTHTTFICIHTPIQHSYAYIHAQNIHMHTYTHKTFICIHTPTQHSYAYIHAHNIHMHTYTHTTFICIHTPIQHSYAYIHPHNIHMHTYTHTTFICIHTRTQHSYAYIHAQHSYAYVHAQHSYAYIHPHNIHMQRSWPSLRRWLWGNGYCCRKWTQQHEFKSRTKLTTFHKALIPLRKVKSSFSSSSYG